MAVVDVILGLDLSLVGLEKVRRKIAGLNNKLTDRIVSTVISRHERSSLFAPAVWRRAKIISKANSRSHLLIRARHLNHLSS